MGNLSSCILTAAAEPGGDTRLTCRLWYNPRKSGPPGTPGPLRHFSRPRPARLRSLLLHMLREELEVVPVNTRLARPSGEVFSSRENMVSPDCATMVGPGGEASLTVGLLEPPPPPPPPPILCGRTTNMAPVSLILDYTVNCGPIL